MFELMNERKKNLDYNEVINELIDMYQENTWGNFGAESAGGQSNFTTILILYGKQL